MRSEPSVAISHADVDWHRVTRAVYDVRQHYRYTYSAPVSAIRQRLIMVPPDGHGDQQLLWHTLDVLGVDPPGYELAWASDVFGNHVCQITATWVKQAVDFNVHYQVRRTRNGVIRTGLDPARFLLPTALTAPDEVLQGVAADIRAASEDPAQRAERAHDWAAQALAYKIGETGVHTPAAMALYLGKGVCQDYAHILLCVLRLLGVPARYVSGHLLGEGAPHAWVEALVEGQVIAYDPTHHRRTRLNYITVAVGRDFADVSPTSGTFSGAASGQLSSNKQARILDVEYGEAV